MDRGQASGRTAASTPESNGGRARIVAAGRRLFATSGFTATSMRQLATEAGLPNSAPYDHFASKQSIFLAVAEEGYEHCLRDCRQVVVSCASDSAVEQLAATVGALAVASAAGEPVLALRFDTDIFRLGAAAEAARMRRERLWTLVTDIIARGQTRGDMVTTEPPVLVMMAIRGLVAMAAPTEHAAKRLPTDVVVPMTMRLVGAGSSVG